MADDDLPSNIFGNNERENNVDPNLPQHIHLDLGDDSSRTAQSNRLGNQNSGNSGSGTSEGQKREDNPFSFKHFLRSDSGNSSYQHKGARPKVYCESRPTPSTSSSDLNSKIPEPKQSRIVPEFSSALPDFVQDHLVIEQCYLGSNSSSNYNLELNNLPDFTRNRDTRPKFENASSGEPASNTSKPIPLDLPIRPQGSFPLDLPIGNSSSGPRSSTISEVGNSKSLPDFLADSAVCSQKNETLSVPHSPESESERLRHELDMTRRQLSEQTRLCESLSRELDAARNKEHEYTQNLGKALEQVEQNLEKSNRRATSAESTVLKLKQEVKSLTIQINNLKLENQNLRGDEAAGGQGYYNPVNELHSHRLAQELRNAASSAEHSLRQLLTGVDNLRIMAAALENMHRIEEKNDPFPNFDEDAGPAL
ncbi:serologically defined colon cancer antigen 3 homolog isoform X2 [Anoplophora glabripennis]|uniref:serologically defined colon cancer antigen 3 homolog isoform X2 n=1 Tax=Anoplophora glabripennis TaxID=217634 RepID=UPI0008739F5C|nr:serologically defined colon cancer antigen 3 homolog isoform X2 [Anoplophora glabripennis]